ncbi:DUF421 domain-containing protein [Bacillus sp. KH172YL63]|uniref:DUF421 domain-containing protein n=1 Tax=Bacillus sp. KH172YL63 TaxID=2709784 RepID=UPI0013E4D71F|nr:DUF421 domain-containing protein [Bacillus sp. KH172YL63]BCB03928.1 DUF421 domain-containing protein [Bacillus sp. KH172YL63]
MDMDLLWKAIIIVIGGTLLLRIAGRKSISQMTLAQTVIMIGIGSLLIQPLAGESVFATLAVGMMLVLSLVIIEYVQVKSDTVETFITGKSKILIQNGQLNETNLKSLRFTVDQLEMKLRQHGVASIDNVKWATLEPNGQVGYELKSHAQHATKQDIERLQQEIQRIHLLLDPSSTNGMQMEAGKKQDIFKEVADGHHRNEPPQRLQ